MSPTADPDADPAPPKPRGRRLLTFGGLALGGAVALPIAVFLFGERFMEDYAGDGLGGFLGTLLAELAGGDPAAWLLVVTPALLLATWWLVAQVLRRPPRAD